MSNVRHNNVFNVWLDRMADELGVTAVTVDRAAELLGKTPRMISYFIDGSHSPQLSTLMLMDALVQGYRPKKWAA